MSKVSDLEGWSNIIKRMGEKSRQEASSTKEDIKEYLETKGAKEVTLIGNSVYDIIGSFELEDLVLTYNRGKIEYDEGNVKVSFVDMDLNEVVSFLRNHKFGKSR